MVIDGPKDSPVVLGERSDLLWSKYKLLISEAAAHQALAHRTALTMYGNEKKTPRLMNAFHFFHWSN